MRRLLTALALVLTACSPTALRENTSGSQTARDVRALVEAEAGRQRLIGVEYTVLLSGERIADGAFGHVDLDSEAPVTADTEFLIASVTKSMTAAAALRMAARGALDLDAPIHAYVPNFPTHPDGVATPRLLLNHRGGIRHYRAGELNSDLFSRHFDIAEASLEVFRADAYIQAPGAGESYSSFGYALLAAAMERAAGKPFTQVLGQEVFAPLHLARMHVPNAPLPASYSYFDAQTNTPSERPLRARTNDYSYNPGGGNVMGNARSLAQYGRAFVRPGFLSARSLALITGDLPDTAVDARVGYATLATSRYGWVVGRDPAGRLFLHSTGASEAFQAGLTVFPEQDLVIAALTNTWGINSRAGGFTVPMHLAIAARVLDGAHRQ